MEVRAAEVLLASAVLGAGEVEAICEAEGVGQERLGTGVKSLDGAVGGGVCGGSVVCVSGEGSEVCRTLLVNSLLGDPDAVAAVVDTTGNFDVMRLYTLIRAQLQRRGEGLGRLREGVEVGEEAAVGDVAAEMLDRVKIMRVFDFVGVREAIGEIRDELEGRNRARRHQATAREAVVEAKPPTPEPHAVPKRTVVADSEDEDEDEEMLFDSSTPVAAPEPAVQRPDPASSAQRETGPGDAPQRVTFILIDNLAQVINPLLKKDYVKANALASTFLHTLTHLTRTHSLHTILANPATRRRAASPTRPTANQQQPQEHQKQQPPPPPSIFASNAIVPALASILPRYVDVSLLVSSMPRKKLDAKVFYRDEASGHRGVKKPRGVEMVGVLEVVGDQWEGLVGAWGTFVEGENGLLGD